MTNSPGPSSRLKRHKMPPRGLAHHFHVRGGPTPACALASPACVRADGGCGTSESNRRLLRLLIGCLPRQSALKPRLHLSFSLSLSLSLTSLSHLLLFAPPPYL